METIDVNDIKVVPTEETNETKHTEVLKPIDESELQYQDTEGNNISHIEAENTATNVDEELEEIIKDISSKYNLTHTEKEVIYNGKYENLPIDREVITDPFTSLSDDELKQLLTIYDRIKDNKYEDFFKLAPLDDSDKELCKKLMQLIHTDDEEFLQQSIDVFASSVMMDYLNKANAELNERRNKIVYERIDNYISSSLERAKDSAKAVIKTIVSSTTVDDSVRQKELIKYQDILRCLEDDNFETIRHYVDDNKSSLNAVKANKNFTKNIKAITDMLKFNNLTQINFISSYHAAQSLQADIKGYIILTQILSKFNIANKAEAAWVLYFIIKCNGVLSTSKDTSKRGKLLTSFASNFKQICKDLSNLSEQYDASIKH